MSKASKLSPLHPGEILLEEFIYPLGLSMNKLALELRVPTTRIADIVHGRRSVTPDTALRLAQYFKTTARFWMNLQTNYDLQVAEEQELERVKQEVRPREAVAATRA